MDIKTSKHYNGTWDFKAWVLCENLEIQVMMSRGNEKKNSYKKKICIL